MKSSCVYARLVQVTNVSLSDLLIEERLPRGSVLVDGDDDRLRAQNSQKGEKDEVDRLGQTLFG